MNWFTNLSKTPRFFVWVALAIYFAFGLANIGNYITADEHFWLPNLGEERIQEYWDAILTADWGDTDINDKPGITLAIIAGTALPFANDLIDKQILFDVKDNPVKVFDPHVTKKLNTLFHFPLLLFNGLFVSLYLFWIIKVITKNEYIASWSVIAMLLSPVLLGISQITNPDTLFWVFGSASILTFYAYLQERKKTFVWLGALLFGFTLASKYVGVIFFPFFLLMIGISYLYNTKLLDDRSKFSATVKRDIWNYFTVLTGGVALFSFLMPAAIVDPEVLYESTIGFPGMLPFFILCLTLSLALLADAILLKSMVAHKIARTVSYHRKWLERTVFGILLATTVFVLLNWTMNNSFLDLTHIKYYEKTKEAFTTENPYLHRYLVQFVPLVFSLVPITLFLLFFVWIQGIFNVLNKQSTQLVFTLSVFFLVFYIAVIEQGLLVTARYSIILFPLALVLGAVALWHSFQPKEPSNKRESYTRLMPGIYLALPTIIALGIGITKFHNFQARPIQRHLENFVGANPVMSIILGALAVFAVVYFTWKYFWNPIMKKTPFALASVVLIVCNAIAITGIFPHTFVYVNDLLPDRYILSNPWGYGGYEVAEFLNKKENAKDTVLWTDAPGVCEFFVGKCIVKQRNRVLEYPIDYMLRSYRGPRRPMFPYIKESEEPVFSLDIDKRSDNFVNLYKIDKEATRQKALSELNNDNQDDKKTTQ